MRDEPLALGEKKDVTFPIGSSIQCMSEDQVLSELMLPYTHTHIYMCVNMYIYIYVIYIMIGDKAA
jgi:hypothetical protein